MPAKRETVRQPGEQPIDARKLMNMLADTLDDALNPGASGSDRKLGFVLLVFKFGKLGRYNFISNGASHRDIAKAFRELADEPDQGQDLQEGPGGVM